MKKRLLIIGFIIMIGIENNCVGKRGEEGKKIKGKIEMNENFLGTYDKKKKDFVGLLIHYNKKIYTTSKINDKYRPENMIDGNIKTCWATSVNRGIGEQILLIGSSIARGDKLYNLDFLQIYNGYCKNKEIYYKNNRIKRMRMEIYRVIVFPIDTEKGLRWYTMNKYINCIYKKEVKLKDKYLYPNNIKIEINIKKDYQKTQEEIGMPTDYLFLFTIEDIYKGSKYNDLCVSEIKFIYK